MSSPRKFHSFGGCFLSHLEDGSVANLPIRPLVVQWLKTPIFHRPAAADRLIAIVNLSDQVRDRTPTHLASNISPHIQVNARHKEISTRLNHSCDVTQAGPGIRRFHMAEKTVSHNQVLWPDRRTQRGTTGIIAYPGDLLPEVRPDPRLIVLHFKHRVNLFAGHTLEHPRVLIP